MTARNASARASWRKRWMWLGYFGLLAMGPAVRRLRFPEWEAQWPEDLLALLLAPVFVAPLSLPLLGLAVFGYRKRANPRWALASLAGWAVYMALGGLMAFAPVASA